METHNPFYFNEKQKRLFDETVDHPSPRAEFSAYVDLKEQLVAKDIPIDGNIRNQRFKVNFQLAPLLDVDLKKDKLTPTFFRDYLGFVPKQSTSFARFIKEVKDYQTKSVILHHALAQDSDIGDITPTVSINSEFDSGGIMWLTFYDNDTKLIVYEFSPHVQRRTLDAVGQLTYFIEYKPSVTRAILINGRIQVSGISITGLGGMGTDGKNYYLHLDDIQARRYQSINNLQSSVIGVFDEELV